MEQSTGVILSSAALDRITPGETTYQEVLRLWDIEHHEVVIEFDGDHVRDLQADVRRMRGVPGDDSFPGRR